MPFTTTTGSSGISTVEGTVGGDRLGGLNINKKVRLNALEGNDVLKLLSKTGETFNAVSIYGNAGTDEITTATAITGSLIQGGGDGDTITANTSNTEITVRGGSGNDIINAGSGGNKTIFNGNKEIDLIVVGGTFQNSSINGGDGVDEIRLQGGIIENTDISGDKGADVISDQAVGISLDFRGTSSIYGNDGNDTISLAATTSIVKIQGGAGLDTITGGTGNDILKGGTEDDRITGGNGNDSIEGNLALDNLAGGEGDDTITGGAGNDALNGNNGQDVFIQGATDSTASTARGAVAGAATSTQTLTFGGGIDTITAFIVAAGANQDKIDVATAPTLRATANVAAAGATSMVNGTTYAIRGTQGLGGAFVIAAGGPDLLYGTANVGTGGVAGQLEGFGADSILILGGGTATAANFI